MRIAVCTSGINEWETYTLPLIQSAQKWEPAAQIIVIDNESNTPYPDIEGVNMIHTRRICYAAALNTAARAADDPDWYIFLCNDTLFTSPFADMLKAVPPGYMVGPTMNTAIHYRYIPGWCMCVPRHVWQTVGEFDENYLISCFEDVDYSYRVMLEGYRLGLLEDFPLIHVDQRQRNKLVDINAIQVFNGAYFERKHHIPRPLLRYSPASLVNEVWG